ncbi:MAG: pyridoxamine 5'-phosphate oxidase family protein, partial [Actinomycetota bacterium]|nr:pyridoxamine 5'-phosphate oxidase family protein [Actinomycetota bacterium]
MRNYGVSEAEEGMLSWEWVSGRMSGARNYWISTTRPDGRPHAAPVWGVWVDETLYFGTDPNSRKARNLARNPNVAVHLESGDEVVIVEGVAEELTAPAPSLSRKVVAAYAAKDQDPDTGEEFHLENAEGLKAVRPRVVFAWLERDFPSTATRWL